MSHSLRQTEGGFAAPVRPLPHELREHLHHLRIILPVITDAVVTLRRQNADADADVAYDLTEQVCEPLDYEIGRIESLLVSHVWLRPQQQAQT